MTEYDLGQVVGSAGADGNDGSTIWYTSTAPTYANSKYTFTISNLSGKTGFSVAVSDLIFYNTYYYIVSTVNSTTVDCSTRVSIKGSDASVTVVDNLNSDSSTSVLSAKQGKVLNTNKVETSAIATSFGSTTSDSKVPSEKLVKTELDKKIATSNTAGLVKNDGSIDTSSYITSASVPTASSTKPLEDDYYNGKVGTSTKYAREDHAHGKLYHWSTGGVSTATYVDLLEFTMTQSWQNRPLFFGVTRRTKDRPYYVGIRFSNTNLADSTYTVQSFKVWGESTAQIFYLRKVEDNKYRLCAYKSASDTYTLFDMVSLTEGITITKIPSAEGNYGTTAPSGSAPDLYTSTQLVNLNTSDIADNLTTNDATKVLSAKQGKALNDLIGDAITYINQ